MTVAADARDAARRHPFLLHALRAGLVNYAAAAEFLDVDGETDAVATALRRYAEELSPFETASREARVTMQSGVGVADDPADALLRVGPTAVGDDGDGTAVLATGDVDPGVLATVLSRLAVADVDLTAAGVAAETMVVVVGRRDGATALRVVEDALETVPV